jgi:hypothetical protein
MNNIAKIERQAPPVPFEHQIKLAESFAKSGLFGIKTADQALALMALCEAEGLHPAIAVRDYHLIQGKPALKADAMMARFQAAGGKVEWKDLSDERVCATFSHPAGGSATIDWDMARAKSAGFAGKDNWKKFPRAMLRSRVVSEGIRTVFPGVVVGVYTPEEVADFDDRPAKPEPRQEREAYSDDRFIENLPGFEKAIADGKDPEQIISMISSKYELSPEQARKIRSLAAVEGEVVEDEA